MDQPEVFRASRSARERLAEQSSRIADALERQGILARQPAHQGQALYAVGELTGRFELLDAGYRHIQLIPEVAQRESRSIKRELEFYLRRVLRSGRFVRYAVVTSGGRVPFGGELRERRREHGKNVSRWASDARRLFGIEVLFRRDELTLRRACDDCDDGQEGVHAHSNILYLPTRKLSPEDWTRFLTWSRSRLGGVMWKDCGVLKDVAEVVKYVTKLGAADDDVEGSVGLDGLTDDELAWLHHEMVGTKLSNPMGWFRTWRQELAQSGERIARVRVNGEPELRRVEAASAAPKADRRLTANKGPAENIVLGRLMPHARFTRLHEPVSLVINYSQAPATGIGRQGLEFIRRRREQAAEWASDYGSQYDANCPSPGVTEPNGSLLRDLAERRSEATPSEPTPTGGPGSGAEVKGGPEPRGATRRLFAEHGEHGEDRPLTVVSSLAFQASRLKAKFAFKAGLSPGSP